MRPIAGSMVRVVNGHLRGYIAEVASYQNGEVLLKVRNSLIYVPPVMLLPRERLIYPRRPYAQKKDDEEGDKPAVELPIEERVRRSRKTNSRLTPCRGAIAVNPVLSPDPRHDAD